MMRKNNFGNTQGNPVPPRHVMQATKLRDSLPKIFVKAVQRDSSPLSGKNGNFSEDETSDSDLSDDENGYICKKCRNGKEKKLDGADLTLNNVSAAVFAVAHQLRKSKERRKCLLEQEQIKEIKIRVNDALEHAGIDTNVDEHETTISEPLFIDQEKAKRDERKTITDKFTLSENLTKSRNNLMLDIDSWLYYLQEDLNRLCEVKMDANSIITEEEFGIMNEALKKSNLILLKIEKSFKKHLLKANKLKSEKQESNSAKTAKGPTKELDSQVSNESFDNNEERLNIPNKVITEKELNNPKSLTQAVKTITAIFEDGSRTSSSSQARKNYKIGLKQFKAMSTSLERKTEYVAEIEQQNKKLAEEVTNAKFIEQQKKADSAQIKQLKEENDSLSEKIKELLRTIDELNKRPSIKSHHSRHTERRVSIQLPYDQEASVEIFVAGDDSESVMSVKENLKRELSSRRSMVSRSYLQPTNSSMDRKKMQTPSIQMKPTTSIRKTQSNQQSHFISPSSVVMATDTGNINDINEPANDAKQENVNTDTKVPQDEVTTKQNQKSSVTLSATSSVPQETEKLKQQINYFRGMLKNTEQTIADQQKEIERLLYAKTERQPSTLNTPNTDMSSVKSSKSLAKGLDKKIEHLENQLKKTKHDRENVLHDFKEQKRTNEYLRLEVQKLLIEKEKLERKLYKECTTKFETNELSRDQLLKKFRNEAEKEVQRLRSYIINEQNRYQANLRRIHAEHKNTISSLKGENVQIIRALNRFKHVVMQMLNENDIKELENIDEVSQEEKLRLYEQGKDSMTLQETALEIILLLEKSLQKLVLEKRLMIKQAQSNQQNTEQELGTFKLRFENATLACVEQDQLIRRANERNEILTKQYNELVVTNNDLQKEISPCKELLNKYNNMQREIDRINSEEKAHAKETKHIIKEFEIDRNRLKKELNRLNLSQICQLNVQQSVTMQGKNLQQKIEVIDKAYENNRINFDDHERATEIIEYKNEITTLQFARLVERYVQFKKMQNLNEFLLLLGESYQDEKRFQSYYDNYKKREDEAVAKWTEKKKDYREKREQALLLLMKVFNKSMETSETSLTSFSLFRRSDDVKQAYRRKMMTKRKSIPKFPSTISDVVGTQLQTSKIGGSYWQMPPDMASNLVQISTPRLLEMDIIECRRPALMMTKRNPLHPAVASLFDIGE